MSIEHKDHIPTVNNSSLIPTLDNTKEKVYPLISKGIHFRRRMFHTVFSPDIQREMDDYSLDFFRQTAGWFDEIVLIKLDNGHYVPVYDYSLRNYSQPPIDSSEFDKLISSGRKLTTGDWTWVDSAEGLNFDMVGKINDAYLICVNNTEASIGQLSVKYKNRIFEEVKPVIEKLISTIKNVLSK